MVALKLMASPTSRNSDLKKKQSMDFLGIERSSSSARDSLFGDTLTVDGFLRSGSAKQNLSQDQVHCPPAGREAESSKTRLNAVGAVAPVSGGDSEAPRIVRKTVDDVWTEIVAGKKSERQPKEEMMTLEDFLLKAGAVEEDAAGSSGAGAAVKVEQEGLSGGIYASENSGKIGEGIGMDVGELGRGRGKRTLSLLEPLDKSAEQRQKRMIKNRESAARSRERKQAYQVELELMSVRLKEENDQLLKEKAERMKKRLKQLMENVIPVAEKRRPLHILRKVRSMQW